jgi:hypothetical protein
MNEGKMEFKPKKIISMNSPAFSTGKDFLKILYKTDITSYLFSTLTFMQQDSTGHKKSPASQQSFTE